jgi:hypothetical protein
MSRPDTADAAGREDAVFDAPICDYCGCYIVEGDQDCPALDDGVCFP